MTIYVAMKYESALVNGLIGDFTTVISFWVDWVFYDIPLNWLQFVGCFCVGYVVVFITFGKL